jgi:hypothetical protein
MEADRAASDAYLSTGGSFVKGTQLGVGNPYGKQASNFMTWYRMAQENIHRQLPQNRWGHVLEEGKGELEGAASVAHNHWSSLLAVGLTTVQPFLSENPLDVPPIFCICFMGLYMPFS